MRDRSWNFDHYKRDLAIIGVGLLAVAAAVGAAVGVAVDVLMHRHRAAS